MKEQVKAVVLAAGRGTRMKEINCKVLIAVESIPMIKRIVESLKTPDIKEIIVVTSPNYQPIYQVLGDQVRYAIQKTPKGTMDAVGSAFSWLEGGESSLILPADIPYLDGEFISQLISEYLANDHDEIIVVAMKVSNPKGYGRIISSDKSLKAIIEEKDASIDQLSIDLVNTGIYIIPNALLKKYYQQVLPSPVTGEYYLTSLINLIALNHPVKIKIYPESRTLKGANDIDTLRLLIKNK